MSFSNFSNFAIQRFNNPKIQQFNHQQFKPKKDSLVEPKKLVLCWLSLAQLSPLLLHLFLWSQYRKFDEKLISNFQFEKSYSYLSEFGFLKHIYIIPFSNISVCVQQPGSRTAPHPSGSSYSDRFSCIQLLSTTWTQLA